MTSSPNICYMDRRSIETNGVFLVKEYEVLFVPFNEENCVSYVSDVKQKAKQQLGLLRCLESKINTFTLLIEGATRRKTSN